MKERLLDVIKWGLVLIIAGAVFYVVYPRYEFGYSERGIGIPFFRCNTLTGEVEKYNRELKIYKPFGE